MRDFYSVIYVIYTVMMSVSEPCRPCSKWVAGEFKMGGTEGERGNDHLTNYSSTFDSRHFLFGPPEMTSLCNTNYARFFESKSSSCKVFVLLNMHLAFLPHSAFFPQVLS